MNKLIIIFLMSFFSVAAGESVRPNIEIKTKGLICQSCGIGIKKWLKKNSAVKVVKFNVEKSLTLIFLEKNKAITDRQIREAIKKAGYEATSIKRNP